MGGQNPPRPLMTRPPGLPHRERWTLLEALGLHPAQGLHFLSPLPQCETFLSTNLHCPAFAASARWVCSEQLPRPSHPCSSRLQVPGAWQLEREPLLAEGTLPGKRPGAGAGPAAGPAQELTPLHCSGDQLCPCVFLMRVPHHVPLGRARQDPRPQHLFWLGSSCCPHSAWPFLP